MRFFNTYLFLFLILIFKMIEILGPCEGIY